YVNSSLYTAFVTFVVEKNGNVTDVRILRGIGGGCDEEAVRVIKAMPKWNPGKQRGKPVRVQFNMPIKFTLAG
ncbi:MAG: energy transducer TonB, partial [Lentimicrobium sp.]|nr:energy transducer TonB [Lentimicrobium sp.]